MRIPIVNEQDEIIEYKEREDVKSPGEIIRATGLWITDKDGNILIAKRAYIKKHEPGLWGPAVSGTVEEGETYDSNVVKEAEEEVGLTGITFTKGPKLRFSNCFGHWFSAVVDRDYNFVKQDEEVEDIKWVSESELNKLLEESPELFIKGFKKNIETLINYEN